MKLFLILLLFLPLLAGGSACSGGAPSSCQGTMLGGNGLLGTGASAGGGEDEDEDDGVSVDLGEDTTNFRPASLPPVVDEPSYLVTASLVVNVGGGMAAVATVTSLSTGLAVSGVEVEFIHVRNSGDSSADLSALALTQTVLRDEIVLTDENGHAELAIDDFNEDTDQVWIMGIDVRPTDIIGTTNTVVVGRRLEVVSLLKSNGVTMENGDQDSSVHFRIKFNLTVDPSTLAANLTCQCVSTGSLRLSVSETANPIDSISDNEFTVTSGTAIAQSEDCTLMIGSGVEDTSGNLLRNPLRRTITLVPSGLQGSPTSVVIGVAGGVTAIFTDAYTGYIINNSMGISSITLGSSYSATDPLLEAIINSVFGLGE